VSRGGGRLWVAIGPLSFEPNEVAKVLLVALFAVPRRQSESSCRRAHPRRPLVHPVAAHSGPLLLRGDVVVLAHEQDVGTSLLFFGCSWRCST
jgi:cell division protein FtsW (lipid II flippase)